MVCVKVDAAEKKEAAGEAAPTADAEGQGHDHTAP